MNNIKSMREVPKILGSKFTNATLISVLLFVFFSFGAFANSETDYNVSSESDIKSAISAINGREDGEYTVTLGSDITLEHEPNNYLKLQKNSVTLRGEGHTLSLVKSYIHVTGNSTLNLGSANYNKTLTIKDKAPQTGNACEPLIAVNNATLNMYKGVTLSGRNGVDTTGGVQLENNAKFNMYGGEISDCRSDSIAGGVLAYNNSQFKMNGGTIKNCNNTSNGGGVYVANNSKFEMAEGAIQNCSSNSDYIYYGFGGGVYLSKSQFKMDGGLIENCSSSKSGGGICSSSSQVEINDGLIKGCNSSTSGGGVCTSNSPFKMTGGTIQNCSSINYGGGIYNNSKFEMTGGTIKGCTSSVGGGGVCIKTPNGSDIVGFDMSGGEIKDCISTSNVENDGLGGGVLIINGKACIRDDSKVYNNHASRVGDDIFSFGADAKLKLSDVPEGLILEETNHEIDGWYVDGVVNGEETARWDKDHFAQRYAPSLDNWIETQIALKAAHGAIDYNYYNYKVKYYIDGKLNKKLTKTGKSDTVHVDYIPVPKRCKIDSVDYVNVVDPTTEAPGSFEAHVYCSKSEEPVKDLKCKTQLDGQVLNVIVQDPNHVLPDDICLKVTLVPNNTVRWDELYAHLDNTSNIKKLAFFEVEILYKSNNKPVRPMPLPADVKVLFQVPDGWDKEDLEAVLVMLGAGDIEFEKDVKNIDGVYYLVFWTKHFSPYALVDRSADEETEILGSISYDMGKNCNQQNLNRQRADQQSPSTGESDLELYTLSGVLLFSLVALLAFNFDRKRRKMN